MQLFRCRPALALVTGGKTPQAVQHRWSSARSGNGSDVDEEELQKARAWLAALHAEGIPLKTIGALSFSRSSGPGGQNVNKVNSKATLRVPLGALLNHVPTALHAELSRSRYVAAKSSDIIIQADDSRKQNDNAHACYKRLYDAIVEAGRNAVPNETSAEQQRHVKHLQKADNERRIKFKKQQSAKKSARRSCGDD
ncbi:peptidyl-tRNA hydrolase domain-containing protein [Didymella exigua CBS 183.55]|uniref:Peptidyl-tRNA hydrolase domain-containing protein n=1 Tax=Didymella exigua CBS 183.55 TaxID=1150837 RepID=A0A6A5RPM9_9PLEO|nr:peptidyl-tRNA hydrolase domain-containing protein [Didymella exigua CBS 183.55]KAF1929108.1 peptidyl-tRNA hydrolase domain-containing protein [Didymella exigua CBS 183.55]